MRALSALLIALFVLSARSAGIGYICDLLSGSSIWNSQTWKTWKIPVIVVAVVTGLSLLTTAASLSSKKHERAEKEFAFAQGWGYSVKNNDVAQIPYEKWFPLPALARRLESMTQ
jgi:hypothetical protein